MSRQRHLTWSTAEKIRQLKKDNPLWGASKIIKELNLIGTSDGAVCAIISGRTYKNRVFRHVNPKQVLDQQKAREIKGQLKLGKSCEWLAVKYGVSMSTIQRIKYGYTWRETA